MKISDKTKIITGSLIIVSMIIMQFSNVKKVNAESVNYGATNSNYGSGDSTSLSGYITGLAPTILQFPGCKSKISNLFGGGSSSIGDLIKPESETASGSSSTHDTAGARSTLSETTSDATAQANAVPTYDATTVKIKEDTSQILTNTQDTKKSVASMDKNENCLNAIGKSVIKLLIQKMTLSIVNWIQTGNSGGPLFVQNPSKFFGDIAKNEILGFGLEINDPTKYPFAKTFMQNIANSFNNKFADNAQYSLDKMIQDTTPQYSAVSFSADFSQGGWNAWEAMTQNPANNPLGFTLMASNELQARLAGTVKSNAEITSDLLQQGNGFLGDERCTDPWGISKEQDQRFLNGETKTFIDSTTGDTMMPVKCNKWEYVTPGAVIGHTLTKSMDDNSNSLLDAQTLNDAIAAILDATVARFSSELTNKGLAAMSTSNDTAYEQTDLGSLFPPDTSGTGTQFASSYITPWIQNHPGFDIKTGVTQALVDEQRTYLDKLNSYNNALADLIKWIRQLDYCIPGPNPDWETTVANTIQNTSGVTQKKTFWNDPTTQLMLGTFDPSGIGNTIGTIINKANARKSAREYLQKLFGVNILETQDEVFDQAGINAVINTVVKSYKEVVDDIYFKGGWTRMTGEDSSLYMPGVTTEARAEFEKINGFQQIIENNTTDINFRKSIITRLQDFKEKIDNETISPADLDNPSSQAVTEFARLSAYLVSGDDIANIDNLAKQAGDEKNYVKGDLLEGDFGCEKFMLNLWQKNPIMYEKYARRHTYPYPLPKDVAHDPIYTLGTYPQGGFLWGSAYFNGGGPMPSDQPAACQQVWVHDIQFATSIASNKKGTEANEDSDTGSDMQTMIGGLSPNIHPYPNTCGVIPMYFETKFGVY